MKIKSFILTILLIVLILVTMFFLSKSTMNYQFDEQVALLNPIVQCNYSEMGDSYEDEIYEKYDSVNLGTQKTGFLCLEKNPIEWIVLAKDDKKVLLLSKYIVDCKPFDYVDIANLDKMSEEKKNNYKSINWENSSLRKWLNNDFYDNCFSSNERKKIIETYLYDVDTVDRIFCLSESEYKKYFFNDEYYDKLQGTQGLNTYFNGATKRNKIAMSYDKNKYIPENDTYEYWLRDEDINKKEYGIEFGTTKIVNYYGDINFDVNHNEFCGVRPAMWVSLD